MTSKELISKLQFLDPTGRKEVFMEDHKNPTVYPIQYCVITKDHTPIQLECD